MLIYYIIHFWSVETPLQASFIKYSQVMFLEFQEEGLPLPNPPRQLEELMPSHSNAQSIRLLLSQQTTAFFHQLNSLYSPANHSYKHKVDNHLKNTSEVNKILAEQVAEAVVPLMLLKNEQGYFLSSLDQRNLYKFIAHTFSPGNSGLSQARKRIQATYLQLAALVDNWPDMKELLRIVSPLIFRKENNQEEPLLSRQFKNKSSELFQGKEQGDCNWQFSRVYAQMGVQQKSIVQIHWMAHIYDRSRLTQSLKLRLAFQNEPCHNLFLQFIELCDDNTAKPFYQEALRCQLIPDYQNNAYSLQLPSLHSSMHTLSIYKALLKKLWNRERVKVLINNPITINQGRVQLRYNLQLLQHIQSSGLSSKPRMFVHNPQTSTKLANFFKTVLENISNQFVVVGQKDSLYNARYACKLFELLEKSMGTQHRSRQQPTNITQNMLIQWIQLLTKWLQMEGGQQQDFLRRAICSLFTIFQLTNWEDNPQFPSLYGYQSDLSKAIQQLLYKLNHFPPVASAWKGINIVLLKWGQTVPTENEILKNIMRKSLECYFGELQLNMRIGEQLFQTPAMVKAFKKMMSSQLFEVMYKVVQKLLAEGGDNYYHPKRAEHLLLIRKIGMIITTRIPFDMMDQLCNVVHSLYVNYAHCWPLLYSFRLWIVQSQHNSEEAHLEAQLTQTTTAYQKLINYLQQQYNDHSQPLSLQGVQLLRQFQGRMNRLLNQLHMKKHRQTHTPEFYQQYFRLLDKMQTQQSLWSQHTSPLLQTQQWIAYDLNPFKTMQNLHNQFKSIIRYYLSNSSKLLRVKEEQTIMQGISKIILSALDRGMTKKDWQFVCEIAGFSPLKYTTNLQTRQILGPSARYNSRFNNDLLVQEHAPFNLASVLYAQLRDRYPQFLKAVLGNLIKHPQQQSLWQLLNRCLIPSVLINGSCIFNSQLHQKSKQDMVLGLYFQQLKYLTNLLTSNQFPPQESLRIMLLLQTKKTISDFFDLNKIKTSKILDKARGPQNDHPRNRFREHHSIDQISDRLEQLGISRQFVEIALENVEVPDHNLVLEWIDNNRDRVEELAMQRAMERSVRRNNSNNNRKQETKPGDIVPTSLDKLKQKQTLDVIVRPWIKTISKEVFSPQMSEVTELKDLLFLFMDNLADNSREKQYANLNGKVCKQLTEMSLGQLQQAKLKLYAGMLEGIFNKTPKNREEFYAKRINYILLGCIRRLEDQQNRIPLYSLLNTALPNITKDKLNPSLQAYLNNLLHVLVQFPAKHKSLTDILFKIGRVGSPELMERVTDGLVRSLQRGHIKENIIGLLNMVFQTDKRLMQVNAELDLKSYLYFRYQHRISSFDPLKQHLLQIDIKEFSTSFSKYERGSAIYEVSRQLLAKKKGKSRYFYYDCRKSANAFDYSSLGECKFVDFALKEYQKNIVRSLLVGLDQSQSQNQFQEIVAQLHKLLLNYRVLLPYAVRQQFKGTNLVDLLLTNKYISKSKFKLLVFLTLNCNLFLQDAPETYQFISLGDYVCSKIVKTLFHRDNYFKFSTYLAALYLLQVKKFSEIAFAKLSPEDPTTLTQYYQTLLPSDFHRSIRPILTQFLNIQFKRRLVDNLSRKYRLAGSQNQQTFQRQFLNLNAFFSALPLKEEEPKRNEVRPARQQQEDQVSEDSQMYPLEDEEDEQGAPLELAGGRLRVINLRNSGPQHIPHQQFLIPLQAPKKAQEKGKPQQEKGDKIEEEEKKLTPIQVVPKYSVQQVLSLFETFFEKNKPMQIERAHLPEPSQPQGSVEVNHLGTNSKVQIDETPLDIALNIKKIAVFQDKMAQLVEFLEPGRKWVSQKAVNPHSNRSFHQHLNRHLLESLGSADRQEREAIFMQLERMMRHRRESREDQQPQVRQLNIEEIYHGAQEFTQAIVPMVVEAPPREQSNQEVKVNQQAIEIEEAVAMQQVPIQLQAGQAQQVQAVNEQHVQVIEQQQVQASKNQAQLQQPQHVQAHQQQVQQQVPHNQPEFAQIQSQNHQHLPQILPVELQQYPIAQIQNIDADIGLIANLDLNQPALIPAQQRGPQIIIPSQNIFQALIGSQPQPNQMQAGSQAANHRQILNVFGLPQSFLRDMGIDEASFDCLPEQMQQQQLMVLINQANQQRQVTNPNDQRTQNIMFLQSLDLITRQQVLIEATPEFLATLPPNIQEQAERYRHSQINRMLQEEEIEQERNIQQRARAPLVYPTVDKTQFSGIAHETAMQLFRNIFIIYPKFKLSALRILLQNKHTQQPTLASIVLLLHYFEKERKDNQILPTEMVWSQQQEGYVVTRKNHWNREEVTSLRKTLLHAVFEVIQVCIYKDNQFLQKSIEVSPNYCPELTSFLPQSPIDTLTQLLSFSLQYYPHLATDLVSKVQNLSQPLLVKLIKGIKADTLPMRLYDNLQALSANAQLKQQFRRQFQETPPKIQLLGKLLKYQFAQLDCLRKIHQQALQYFSPNYLQFLNQIFRIYNMQTLTEIEPVLIKHKQIHFEVIKHLYKEGRAIDKQPIAIILKKAHLIDFQTKKFIFRNHPKIRRTNRQRVHIQVDRTHLFQGSYNQLMSRSVRQLQGRVQVSFVNQPGHDAGGLRREWFLVVSREIFNENYALFEKSSSGSTYQPNPKSYVNPDHLNYFKFIGRFVGKALMEGELIDAFFTRAFYKMILGQDLEFKDLEQQDYQFYKSMQWLKINPIDQNTYTYSYFYDDFGKKVQKELVPQGSTIFVTQQNKKDYIQKYCLAKMRNDFSLQVDKFLQGFYQIVPQECIGFFQAKQLQLLMSGVPQVDVEDMRKNTDYSGYSPADQIIVWFWEIVTEYSQEDLAKLVQFITGTSKIPVEGFAMMTGMNGIQRISIHRDPSEHQLPKSHTCFNQLDLPNYASKQILKKKLQICLSWGSEGFGFM